MPTKCHKKGQIDNKSSIPAPFKATVVYDAQAGFVISTPLASNLRQTLFIPQVTSSTFRLTGKNDENIF